MGSGKSTVGKRLAAVSGNSFLDTDLWIEKQENKKISEIFSLYGEACFRDMETECLKTLLKETREEGYVISVGGGMPVREENRMLLQQLGCVVYLKASPETIYERIGKDPARPLLQTDDPEESIRKLMQEREEKYAAAAERVILTDHKSVEEIVREILAL